jgi:hypothetical protein
MSANEQAISDMVKAGNFDLNELQKMSSDSLTNDVTVSGWEVCYSTTTDQLSQYATVTVNNSGDTITGIGMLTYTGNGSTMICLQYTNGITGESVATSVGTTLYTPPSNDQLLCVVYGFTQNSGFFYITDTLAVGSC